MANTKLNVQLLLRKDQSFASTYVLAAGEPGFEISTNTLKIGDGTKTWAQLSIANKEAIDALIKVVDDKIIALNDTYATDAEVEGVRAALDAAKLDKATYEAYIATHTMTDTQITDAIGVVDAKFANYRTANAQDEIDATLATKAALKEVTDELDTYGDIVTHDAAEFATAEQGAKADAAAVKTEVEAALALKADKSVVDALYTNAQIDELVQSAKDYADTNDANTEYHVEYDSINKKIKLVAGADASKMEIDATDFIKDGMIDTVTIGADNDLVITFNTAAGKENIVLPLDQLVDIYTGKVGDRVTVTVGSDKSVSADLVAGSISKNYLDADVQASLGKADSALQAADLTDYAKTADVVTNAEFEAFNNGTSKTVSAIEADIVAKANKAFEDAKAYADAKEHKNTTYTAAATTNALEFTLTPSEGQAQTVTLVAPTVDVGVTKVNAGANIEVTPETGTGEITIAHESFVTGEYTKDPASSDKTGDVYMMTSIAVTNGHVTGANVKSLAHALESMTFIFDGGTSTTNA